MNDPVMDLVARLPQATVATDRGRRTQARCHRILDRRAPRLATKRQPAVPMWPRVLVGLGMLYFAEALRLVIRVYGLR